MRGRYKVSFFGFIIVLFSTVLNAEPLPKSPYPGSVNWFLAYPQAEQYFEVSKVLLGESDSHAQLEEIIAFWKGKQANAKTDKAFIQQLFYQLHRKNLRTYREFTSLNSLLNYGEYNCLSASAFYGIILQELGYKVRFLETKKHICLLVTNSANEHILLEATDPLFGFITEKEAINLKIKQLYASSSPLMQTGTNARVFQVINFKQLVGLTYYNQAAWQANHGNIKAAQQLLQLGEQWYPTHRFRSTRNLLAQR